MTTIATSDVSRLTWSLVESQEKERCLKQYFRAKRCALRLAFQDSQVGFSRLPIAKAEPQLSSSIAISIVEQRSYESAYGGFMQFTVFMLCVDITLDLNRRNTKYNYEKQIFSRDMTV